MPTVTASRTIAAPVQDLWELISDPHHLPRWWPRVERVEDVHDGAFTEVMRTSKGKVVRADFSILDIDEQTRTLRWEQHVQGTPFERVLSSSLTEVRLASAAQPGPALDASGAQESAGGATAVTIELRQELRRWQPHALLTGFAPRLGSFMVRRAALATIEQALEGLERISR